MSTRTKTLGVAAAITAALVAVPTAVQAYAEPTPTTPTTTESATPTTTESGTTTTSQSDAPTTTESGASTTSDSTTPTTSEMPVPSVTSAPDPVGAGCDTYKSKNGTGPASFGMMASQPASEAIASNPDLSTFSGLISGKINPDVNIVSVIDGGPYVVFAPTNAAFAKVDAATMETLKTDPVALVPVLFYHMVLGYLNPNDVAGKMPTQDGRPVVVTGKGGDVKVNDVKITCAYPARGAYIYMIDSVLTPPTPAAEAGSTDAATTSATTSASESTSATTSASETTSATTSASETPSATTTSTPESSPASESAAPASGTAETSAEPTTVKPAA
ncbi:MAG: fasciclin domain-containing protein [Mycobacterium sp.]|nr:fasciclin domain-containing protein [Mycobacterium sp.]